MGLFDIFKSQKEAPPNVLELLFEAVAGNDLKQLASLCAKHQNEIRESFAGWSKLPEETRKNPVSMKRYAEGLIGIAQTFEQNGDPSLLAHLMRKGDDNTIVLWQNDLVKAQTLINSEKSPEAISLLEFVLASMAKTHSGTAVDEYLPKAFGLLGTAYFKSGQTHNAIECMNKAKSLCEKAGDTEGVNVYEGNLKHITDQA